MTIEEAVKIITLIRMNYPDTMKGMSDNERLAYAKMWHSFFEHDDADLVAEAVRSFMATSMERFAPNIGQIKEQMRKLTKPEQMSESEAWGLVYNALRNGSYGYKEEFDKLPPMVQRIVGSPEMIREWAQLDGETVQSVVASNFQRSYRAIAKQQEEWDKLPPGYREHMRQLADGMFKAFPEVEA